jgi:hypothetical protein
LKEVEERREHIRRNENGIFGIPFGITENFKRRQKRENEEGGNYYTREMKERFHTSPTHERIASFRVSSCMLKSFFYFVHGSNAFVMLRFSR